MARSILIVDDDPGVLNALGRMLQSEYDVRKAASGEEALRLLDAEEPDLLVTDVQLGDANGLEILEKMRTAGRNVPTIVMSGDSTVEQAVKAVKLGAYDFIEKPIRVERLKMTVENCLRFSQLHAVAAELQEELGLETELVGESPAMRELKALIAKVAPTEGRVLILGENGTGKELVAAAIHAGSPRRDRPFVKLNCSAIPAELVESEVFGHEKGAFTGAVGTRKGRFELADGGTLFLDEIGDMPERMQVKLLRVLQEGTFERVGGTRTMKVDVRIIAATNRDLSGMVAEGKFREDLYYRLNVVTLNPPPLREREGDIALLARRFLATTAARNRRSKLNFAPAALEALSSYEFPGNVRQLQNIIERLGILADSDLISEQDVRRALPIPSSGSSAAKPATEGSADADGSVGAGGPAPSLYEPGKRLHDLVRDAERAIILEAIAANGQNKAAAARALGVERAHFYKKCKALGVSVDSED